VPKELPSLHTVSSILNNLPSYVAVKKAAPSMRTAAQITADLEAVTDPEERIPLLYEVSRRGGEGVRQW
jgi:hypothetical protein